MLQTKGYFDLYISDACVTPAQAEKTLKTLYEFGYRTIAINQTIDDENVEPKKKKKKGTPRETTDVVPTPHDLLKLNEMAEKLNFNNFKILNRLTVVFSNQDNLHKITKSPNYKKFDLIAVMPQTQAAFAFTCSTFEADILTYEPENKMLFKINRKLYFQLMDRGYHFELLYSPAIEDSSKRKNIIYASHLYHSYGKSRNIIISSGATNYMLIRSPYDIINLGLILGLNGQQCKSAIQHCCRQTIINSVSRRHGKAVMFVENDTTQALKDVVLITDSEDDEDMEIDRPAFKKSKK